MSDLKVLVVNDHGASYAKPYLHLGYEVSREHSLINTPEQVALVVFTGGSDVDPSLYGKEKHRSTFSNPMRDKEEKDIFEKAMKANIPVSGICRGSQFLCAMAGGTVVQDVTNHCVSHEVIARFPNGEVNKIVVTSSHHQMQNPFNLPEEEYDILAWSERPRSKHYIIDDKTKFRVDEAPDQLKLEPDVIWYPKIKALAAQYHPEWMRSEEPGFIYFQELVTHFLEPLVKERDELIKHREKASKTIS